MDAHGEELRNVDQNAYSEIMAMFYSEVSSWTCASERDGQGDEPDNGYDITLDFGLASTSTTESSCLPSFSASSSSLAGALRPQNPQAIISSLAPPSLSPDSSSHSQLAAEYNTFCEDNGPFSGGYSGLEGDWSQAGTESNLDFSLESEMSYEGGIWWTSAPQMSQPPSSSLSSALGAPNTSPRSDELQQYYDVLASQIEDASESTDPNSMPTAATVSSDGPGPGSFAQTDEEDEDEDNMEEQYIPPYTGTN